MRRFLSKLMSGFRSTNAAQTARRSPHRASLQVEPLEDRLTPTVFFQPQLKAEAPVPGHNGPTLSSTPVTLIFEGSYWQNPTGITEGDVIQSVKNILNSSYLSFATQYRTNGQAHFAGSFDDNSLPLSNGSFAEKDLQTVAAKFVTEQFNAPSARGLYFVITAPGVTDATRQVNGYHDELSHNARYPGLPFSIPEEVPFGRVDNITNTRQNQLDHFSQTFGHELVEAMTDPYIRTQSANQFFPGANFQTTEKFDEVADFEPNGGRYTYRLGNGTLVQAYWSQKDQAFVVPDGTTQNFTLMPRYITPQQGPPNQNDFLGDFDLTVKGDQLSGKNDRFTVQAVTSGPQAGGVRVTLNGESVAFDPNQLANLTLQTLTGDDAVDVESLPSNVTLTVNLGAGHDPVTLGQVGGQLDGLAGNVVINGGGTNSTLTVNDANTTSINYLPLYASLHNVQWSVMGNSLYRLDTVKTSVAQLVARGGGSTSTQTYGSDITYSGLGKIDIFGGQCTNTYDVQTNALGTPLAVHGTGANNELHFDDIANADNAGTVYTLTAGQVTRVGTDLVRFDVALPGHYVTHMATVTYSGVQSLVVEGGRSSNTFNVPGTAAGTATTIDAGPGNDVVNVLGTSANGPLTVDGGAGSDLVRIGSATAFVQDTGPEGGTLANIQGAVTVLDGSGTTALVIDDSGDPAAYFGVNVGSGSLAAVGGAAAIHWTGTTTRLYLGGTAGQSGNTVNVDASVSGGLPEIFTGPGKETVNVFNPSVNNTLTVHGEGGNDTVNVIDPNAAAASYAFDGATLTRTGHNPDGTVSGVFTLQVDGITNVQVNSAGA